MPVRDIFMDVNASVGFEYKLEAAVVSVFPQFKLFPTSFGKHFIPPPVASCMP